MFKLLQDVYVSSLACVCKELVGRGAFVSQCNKYDETPMDKSKTQLGNIIKGKCILCVLKLYLNYRESHFKKKTGYLD